MSTLGKSTGRTHGSQVTYLIPSPPARRESTSDVETRTLRHALDALGDQLAIGVILAEPSGAVLFLSAKAERLLTPSKGAVVPELQRFIEDVASGRMEEATMRTTLPGSRHPVSLSGKLLPGPPGHVLVTLTEEAPRPDLSKRLIDHFGLSARSVQLAQLASLGLTNREIGLRMRLSESSVKTYMHALFREIHVRNRAELVGVVERLARES